MRLQELHLFLTVIIWFWFLLQVNLICLFAVWIKKRVNDGQDQDEAENKAYRRVLPVVYRGRRDIYICKNSNGSDNYVKNHQNVHQKVMETKKRFREEDGFNVEEALEAAVKKRKFLLNRIFEDDAGYHDNNDEGSDEEHYWTQYEQYIIIITVKNFRVFQIKNNS